MSIHDLYSIENMEQDGNRITCRVQIDAGHPVFEGHFPGSPVLPGVVQVEMVKAALANALGKPIRLTDMTTCKFLEILDPRATPEMVISIQYKGDAALDVSATGSAGDKTFFKIRASFI
ncbi:hypothetical protein GCM10010967_46080 [Dyadobacter beijingensis]|uniref:ApeI dehydratase-like domain-containing protein n=1 Tax=Dyadobacter beijingensis TaxID=365489 RepID=A0ABQ2IAV4_9BACT|nr:hypothetical protein [Dyadobacter beijingensis]GGN05667.1 hypothetical protein GCM10010967_46080 [Dyadobacter beijingensis]